MSNVVSNGLAVVSETPKFLALIPATDRRVGAPENAVIAEYSPVKEGLAAVWVHNATDTQKGATPQGTWQGLLSGHYLIVNEVTEENGRAAMSYLPAGYGIEDIDTVIRVLQKRGQLDQYGTNDGYANGNPAKDAAPRVKVIEAVFNSERAHKADRNKIVHGIVLKDGAKVEHVTQKGGQFYIDHGDGTEAKRIEADILKRTYRCVDGAEIDLAAIPTA